MNTTSSHPARPIRLFHRPLSGHAHRVELFLSLPGDLTIADSNAILVYLALRYDASGAWLPADPVGAAPTLADISLYRHTAHAPEGGVPLDAYPNLCAWLSRIEALPGFVGRRRRPAAKPLAVA